MNQKKHQQHQPQRGGNRERRHHRMQQQLMFENPPPLAYGYVDTSWGAHVTMMHHLHPYQRYVWFREIIAQAEVVVVCLLSLMKAKMVTGQTDMHTILEILFDVHRTMWWSAIIIHPYGYSAVGCFCLIGMDSIRYVIRFRKIPSWWAKSSLLPNDKNFRGARQIKRGVLYFFDPRLICPRKLPPIMILHDHFFLAISIHKKTHFAQAGVRAWQYGDLRLRLAVVVVVASC